MKSIARRIIIFLKDKFRRITQPRIVWGYITKDGLYLNKTRISNSTVIISSENLNIENNVFIGHFNFIDASNGVTIEEGCQITNYVSILTHSSHNSIRLYGKSYTEEKEPKGYITGSVHIGKYTFIGPYSVIMPGSRIGKGCIVAAYSYVKGNFPDFSIISGNPARVVGNTKDLDKKYLEMYPELKVFYKEWSGE